jgi:hypothetical protein
MTPPDAAVDGDAAGAGTVDGAGAAIPPEFVGGWARVSISIGGGEPHEDSSVWWLQTPTLYGDLRVPFVEGVEPDSFAGRCMWDEPSLTWTHDLDLRGWATADTGRVHWDGELLIEEGDGYVEVWERIAGSGGPTLALVRSDDVPGTIVRTGDVAVTIIDSRAAGGEYQATTWRCLDDTWTAVAHWPRSGAGVLPAPPPLEPLAVGDEIEIAGFGPWTVREVNP